MACHLQPTQWLNVGDTSVVNPKVAQYGFACMVAIIFREFSYIGILRDRRHHRIFYIPSISQMFSKYTFLYSHYGLTIPHDILKIQLVISKLSPWLKIYHSDITSYSTFDIPLYAHRIICIHIYIYIYTFIHACTHTHAHMFFHILNTFEYIYIYIHIYIYTQIDMYL